MTIDEADEEALEKQLKEEFGYDEFLPGQARACHAIMQGRDTLLLMATGSGKSLCYQLPSFGRSGTTLVVSPLIALAEDQANILGGMGHSAITLNSTLTKKQVELAREVIQAGQAEFVFTTPERLQRTDICSVLNEVGVNLFAIDEAHCANQWGHDFRPDYLCLHHARRRLGSPPVIAMTATATPSLRHDLCESLRLVDPVVISTGVNRPNLRITVRQVSGDSAKIQALRILLLGGGSVRENFPAIVYCATRKTCESLCEEFTNSRFPVSYYHAGMKKADRLQAQENFMEGKPSLMFATNAFGLGIDKEDIRQIVHYDIPGSLDAYYQEIGRAGRDGETSSCTLLYDPEDVGLQKLFASGSLDATELMNAHNTLVQGLDELSEDDGESVRLSKLHSISPLSRRALREGLQLLAGAGLVSPAGRGRWTATLVDVGYPQMEQIAEAASRRAEDRQIAVRRMVDFASGNRCRWQTLRDHFEDQSSPQHQCLCDCCFAPTKLSA